MKKTLIFALTFILLTVNIYSKQGVSVMYITGMSNSNLSGLNSKFASNGIPKVEEAFSVQGASGYFTFDRIVLGLEAAALLGNDKINTNYIVGLDGMYGKIIMGYALIDNGRLSIIPRFGVGKLSMDVKVEKRNNNDIQTVDDALTLYTEKSKFNMAGTMLDAGVSMEYNLGVDGMTGFMFGIEMGYKFLPLNADFTMDDLSLKSTPAVNMNGYYFVIKLGAGQFN
ncbi:hypothetical protein EV215_0446 [Hypnocyclicus thermotrophus]|uniref:Uncharacterized protein n=1 Tax=Hypnocyclicus thermotrophus TaxID=1627895 RepID=A0AA46DZE3_9FUSO|nr:hypothetical protein [Hypnocyclicus thermotrophus]TDT71762.1 hypothetical protein EV215_0446 [Hypnocyclicus thermotrophus]